MKRGQGSTSKNTTREFAGKIKGRKINWSKLKGQETNQVFNHSLVFKMIWNLGILEQCRKNALLKKCLLDYQLRWRMWGRQYIFQEVKESWFQGKDQQIRVQETALLLGWDAERKNMGSEGYWVRKSRTWWASFQLPVLRKVRDFKRGQLQRSSLLA